MNIKKRLIISNSIIVIVPIIITTIIMSSILFVSLKITGNRVEYDEFERRMFIESELITITDDILEQENKNIEEDKFQSDLSSKLSKINGKFVIIKSHKIIAKPEDVSKIDVEKSMEISKGNNLGMGKKIKINNTSHIIKTIKFNLKDKSEGIIILLVPIEEEKINLLTKFIIVSTVIFIISFVITNMIMSYFLSKSIIKPIKSLKKATTEISNGNLDCAISEEGDEEIRELCRGFETMRVQLKDSIIMKMKYDDNRKGLISSISHDLRTPITSIKGYVEGILDGIANTAEKREKYLKT
ncbi:HAMP domain-containing protein, partial [Clostridium cochlearium]